jgi:hypothetical protein
MKASGLSFILLLLILSIFLFNSCNQRTTRLDCTDYHKGRFRIRGQGIDSYLMERNDSLQYEWNTRKGTETLYRIRWISDCEYELMLRNPTGQDGSGGKDALLDSIMKMPSRVTIITATPSYCIFEVRKKGMSMVLTDTMWLMK